MELPEDDLEFLDEISAGVDPLEVARKTFELAQTEELRVLYDKCSEEAGAMAASGLAANGQSLAAIVMSDPCLLGEFCRFRDGFFLYALARGYGAGYEAGKAV